MGKRGTKAKPTAQKKAEGVQPCRINDNEPQYETCLPECPKFLDAYAREEWYRLGDILFKQGLISEANVMAFSMLCEAWSVWRKSVEELDGAPLTVPGRYEGQTVKNPLFSNKNEAFTQLKPMLLEFGLTPSSLQKVNATPPKDKKENDPKGRVAERMRGKANIVPIGKASNG